MKKQKKETMKERNQKEPIVILRKMERRKEGKKEDFK